MKSWAALAIDLLILTLAPLIGAYGQTLIRPADYLASQPKPNFKPGHLLPHLTRWGWQLSSNTCVELARNWDYTLDLGWANTAVTRLTNSNSLESGFIALAKSDPSKYALSVLINRTFPTPIPDGFYCTNSAGLFVDASTNAWQSATNTLYRKIVSPEGPDDYWRIATDFWVNDLRVIRSQAPIAIVLNGGEYGLDVAGFGKNAWLKDPRVQAATNGYGNLGASLSKYASDRKAHQLGFVTSAINTALPDRELYIFYNTGNEQYRYSTSPTWYPKNNPPVNWFSSFSAWGWNSAVMVTNTDLPSFSSYFTGTWTSITNPWVSDILTRHLDAVGYNAKLGQTRNYSWVCGGWGADTTKLSDIPHYIGFLKCLYTAGMVGAVAGYFQYPTGGFDVAFAANNPPHWLLQLAALGQVHALFSQLDNFLFDGDLLPGPLPHSMAGDQPAYEFPTGDPTARVLARKLRAGGQWLVTAWAADGDDRDVSATIPDLGQVQVRARASGAVYRATGTNATLVDVNGLLPTAVSSLPSPSNLRVVRGSRQ